MRFRIAALLSLMLPIAALAAVSGEADSGPRNGKYLIMSYGAVGRPPLHLGYFFLERGKYKAYLPGDRLAGAGEWKYDAAQKNVIWTSGPYAGVWDGKFKADRGGKTHNLRMKSSTIGTNSID
jgi:hypothetical protein